jgi:hypothetical protein
LGDLGCGHLFDLVQDEYDPAADVNGFEGSIQSGERLALGDLFGLRRGHARARGRVSPVRVFGVSPTVTPRIAGDAQNNLKQPRARPVAAIFELIETAVRNNEHFLRAILYLGCLYTEAAKVTPNEIYMCIVQKAEVAGACLRARRGYGKRLERWS